MAFCTRALAPVTSPQAEIQRLETTAGREAVSRLLSAPGDADGRRGVEAYTGLLEAFRERRNQSGSDARALAWTYQKKLPSSPVGSTPEARAYQLFVKTTYGHFLDSNPFPALIEDTNLELSHPRFAVGGVSAFGEELQMGHRHMLFHAETANDLRQYLYKSRNTSAWSEVLPKDRLARVDFLSRVLLSNRERMHKPQFETMLRQMEEPNRGQAQGIDQYDLMMKMAEITAARRKQDPENAKHRTDWDFLRTVVAPGVSPSRENSALSRAIDKIAEEERSKDPVLSQENDERNVKRAMVLDYMASEAQSPEERDGFFQGIRRLVPDPQLRSNAFIGCRESYARLLQNGFSSVSVPLK